MKTALYRIWGNEGQLLYVGISKSALSRLGQHLAEKSWAADIVNVTIETYPTRELAAAAEIAAIKTEKPLHNVTHNDGRGHTGSWHPQRKQVLDKPTDLSKTKGLEKGQFIAAGMKSGKCYVGHVYLVEGVTNPHVELELKSWVSGYYGDGGYVTLEIAQIEHIEFAVKDVTGYVNDDDLGEFQTYWTNCHKSQRPKPWVEL
jgi:hypothetical protein